MSAENENKNKQEDERFEGDEILTLTDEDGKESDYELLLSKEIDGVLYLALIPAEEGEESDEYVILKMTKDEDGEDVLSTIDDDDEFERVADIIDAELFGEEDYDA